MASCLSTNTKNIWRLSDFMNNVLDEKMSFGKGRTSANQEYEILNCLHPIEPEAKLGDILSHTIVKYAEDF